MPRTPELVLKRHRSRTGRRRAIFAVAGAVLGGAAGVLTDFTRGGSIYTRP